MTIAENGHGKAEFYDQLEHCCQLVSETYGKPERASWANSDYIRLGHILYKKTSVQISPNTLKRIFGKIKTDSRYYPQKATRDALAIYVGYADWEQFVSVQHVPVPTPQLPAVIAVDRVMTGSNDAVSQQKKSVNRWVWVASLVGLTLLLLLIGLNGRLFLKPATNEPVRLLCKKPLGETPHSAIFEVQGFSNESDTYLIDFGDGKQKAITAGIGIYNHYYEVPGRYLAVLKQGNRNLDTATVYLPTRGWTATATMVHDTTRVYPIEVDDLFHHGKKSITASELARAGIDTNQTFFVEFINTQATKIDGDNFELTASVTTSPIRTGVRCSQVGLTVFGERSRHSFDVIKPGCVYWSHLQLSERYRSGQYEDLSCMGADLRAGGTLKLQVANQHVRLFIDGHQVVTGQYTVPLRQIYGVKIRFAGVGSVQTYSLKDLKTGAVFNGNF